MHKRTFLQALLTAGGCCLICRPLQNPKKTTPSLPSMDDRPVQLVTTEPLDDGIKPYDPQTNNLTDLSHSEADITHVEADPSLNRAQDFDLDYTTDLYLPEDQRALLESTVSRLALVQSSIGHGNFNLISFDDLLFYTRNMPEIGGFTTDELAFIDKVFHTPADSYGFYGDKVIENMTYHIDDRDAFKVVDSGHYLLKGEPVEKYDQLRRDVGNDLMLTSGIRNITKQLYLFLAKARETRGNLSKASRSIAPPGYSFHGVGDFDVGKIGLGERNFTSDFSSTLEFQRMIRLGYVDIRYTDNNSLGVRYEPWHIKIA